MQTIAFILCVGAVPSYRIVEGDIQVPLERSAEVQGNSGVNQAVHLWPLGQIPYYIETAGTNPSNPASFLLAEYEPMVVGAVAHWEEKTCIRFTRYNPGTLSPPYAFFISDLDKCNSPLGISQVDGKNQINLSNMCGIGASIHEIGHTLGLSHEQARNDRDEFIYYDASQVWIVSPLPPFFLSGGSITLYLRLRGVCTINFIFGGLVLLPFRTTLPLVNPHKKKNSTLPLTDTPPFPI